VERYQSCLDFSYEKKNENYFEFSARRRFFCLMVYLSLLIQKMVTSSNDHTFFRRAVKSPYPTTLWSTSGQVWKNLMVFLVKERERE